MAALFDSRSTRGRSSQQAAWWLAAALSLGSTLAFADTYTCRDSQNKAHQADRPIAECSNVTQAIHGADGSIKGYIQPTMSPIERENYETCKREDDALKGQRREAMLRDRNLLTRYPDEATHRAARSAALENATRSIAQSEKRLRELAIERKPLTDDAEFYSGRGLPPKLKSDLDANDAATTAQRLSIANQQAEIRRINNTFDIELARLKRLWNDEKAGTLDPAPVLSASCSRVLSR